MAVTDPTGVPSRARPSVPSSRPSADLTSGMCAVHEANRSPCTKKVTTTAICAALAEAERSTVSDSACEPDVASVVTIARWLVGSPEPA